MLIYMFLNKK